MPSSLLWGLSSLGNVYTLQNATNRWQQVSCRGAVYGFKKLAAAPNGAWGLGSDHQVYIYVFSSAVPIRVQEVTYENERWTPIHGWTGEHLLITDRWNWSSENGLRHLPRPYFRLPSDDWEWEGDWFIDENFQGQITDKGGWQYATDFQRTYYNKPKWRSFVRRRRWMRYRRYIATDRWAMLPSIHIDPLQEPVVDVAVGGHAMHNVPQGFLSVWVITIRGKVVHRYGVSHDCPKGLGWIQVAIGMGHEVSAISVGPSGLVWALTWSGHALVRMGVSWTHPYGTHWVEVEPPNDGEGSKLYSVSVGKHGVWAVTGDGTVWLRKGVSSAEAETDEEAATGSSWLQMYGQLRTVSMGANDQVWGVGYEDMHIFMRTGVTEAENGGKTWKKMHLHYDTCRRRQDTDNSIVSSQTSSRKNSILSEYGSPDRHQMSLSVRINEGQGQVKFSQGDDMYSSDIKMHSQGDTGERTTSTADDLSDKLSEENRRLSETDVSEVTGEDRNTKVLTLKSEVSSVEMKTNCDYDSTSKCGPSNPSSSAEQSNTTVASDLESARSPSKDSILNESSNSCIDVKADLGNAEEGTDNASQKNLVNRLSSTNSDTSDHIIDFVWDYPKDDDSLDTTKEQIRFIHQEDRIDKKSSAGDISIHFQNSKKDSRSQEETDIEPVQEIPTCPLTADTCIDPGCQKHRISPSSSVLDEMEAFVSDPVSLNEEVFDHMYEDTGDILWLNVSAASCSVRDEGEVALWFRSPTDAMYGSHHKQRSSYSCLREEVMVKLHLRNKLQLLPYLSYEHAVDQGTWVKKGKLRWWMDRLIFRSRWQDCSVELEQDLDEVTSGGSFTIYYSDKYKQKHLQIDLSEILAVYQISDAAHKNVMGISTVSQVHKKTEPLKLVCSSLEEMEDWIAWLNKACCDLHGLRAAGSENSLWATTDYGDTLMRQHIPLINESARANIFWRQLGGHLQKVESGGCSVVWGVGYDGTAWVHTGSHGGGLLKGVDSSTIGINTQTDSDDVKIYEYQRWNPIAGYTDRGFLTDGYMWTDETTRKECTKDTAKLPSVHWHWAGDWVVDLTVPPGVTKEGWQYARHYSGPFFNRQRFRKSYIRRRRWMRKCKIVTTGPWTEVGPLPLTDVSLQHHSPEGANSPIALWAIGSNGDVICRLGVTRQNPKGSYWQHVPTDQPFISITVGTHLFVWAVAKDGSAWLRNGITQHKPLGDCWFHVPPPTNHKLRQISAGDNTVWAVDTKDQLWCRQDVMSTFPEGTSWLLVSNNVQQVSVTAHNQVWGVVKTLPEKSSLSNVICKLNIPEEFKLKDVKWQPILGGGFQHVCGRAVMKKPKSQSK